MEGGGGLSAAGQSEEGADKTQPKTPMKTVTSPVVFLMPTFFAAADGGGWFGSDTRPKGAERRQNLPHL